MRVREAGEQRGRGKGGRWSPSLAELCGGGFAQEAELNPLLLCTVLYTTEIISASHLLSSSSAKADFIVPVLLMRKLALREKK